MVRFGFLGAVLVQGCSSMDFTFKIHYELSSSQMLCWRDMHLVTLPPSPIHPPFVPLTSFLLSLPPSPGFVGRDCCAACSLSFWTDTHLPPARRRVCLRNYAIATFFHEGLFGGKVGAKHWSAEGKLLSFSCGQIMSFKFCPKLDGIREHRKWPSFLVPMACMSIIDLLATSSPHSFCVVYNDHSGSRAFPRSIGWLRKHSALSTPSPSILPSLSHSPLHSTRHQRPEMLCRFGKTHFPFVPLLNFACPDTIISGGFL